MVLCSCTSLLLWGPTVNLHNEFIRANKRVSLRFMYCTWQITCNHHLWVVIALLESKDTKKQDKKEGIEFVLFIQFYFWWGGGGGLQIKNEKGGVSRANVYVSSVFLPFSCTDSDSKAFSICPRTNFKLQGDSSSSRRITFIETPLKHCLIPWWDATRVAKVYNHRNHAPEAILVGFSLLD